MFEYPSTRGSLFEASKDYPPFHYFLYCAHLASLFSFSVIAVSAIHFRHFPRIVRIQGAALAALSLLSGLFCLYILHGDRRQLTSSTHASQKPSASSLTKRVSVENLGRKKSLQKRGLGKYIPFVLMSGSLLYFSYFISSQAQRILLAKTFRSLAKASLYGSIASTLSLIYSFAYYKSYLYHNQMNTSSNDSSSSDEEFGGN